MSKYKHLSMHIKIKCPKWLAPVHARREVRSLINGECFHGHVGANGEEIDTSNFKLIACEPAAKHPNQIFVVEGVHFSYPMIPMSIHSTLEGAQGAALALTNMLRDFVKLEPCTEPKGWKNAMDQAREVRAANEGFETVDDLDGDDADGWVDIREQALQY